MLQKRNYLKLETRYIKTPAASLGRCAASPTAVRAVHCSHMYLPPPHHCYGPGLDLLILLITHCVHGVLLLPELMEQTSLQRAVFEKLRYVTVFIVRWIKAHYK